ncbi:MAG: hypothetical protein P9L88_01405 [Candidatus Tantalella remota]|nr:hypothetical protein [Candidatus Tantalella remota]
MKVLCIIIAIGLLLTFACSQTVFCEEPCPLIKIMPKAGLHTEPGPRLRTDPQKGWEVFNPVQVASAPREWHNEVGDTIKKTSSTGKGPLWAKVATSITGTKNRDGEPMFGLKMKL